MFCQFQFGGLYLLDYFCMELQLISKEQNLKLHLISDIFICTFACLTGGIVNVPLCALFYILMSYFSPCYQLLALQMVTVLRKNSVAETHSWQILIKKKKKNCSGKSIRDIISCSYYSKSNFHMFDFYKYTFVRFHSYVKSYFIPSLSLSLSLSVYR